MGKKECTKSTNGFFLEKMGSSCHIMRKKNSKVTIFREQVPTNHQKLRRNHNVFLLPPLTSCQIFLCPLVHDTQPPTSQIWNEKTPLTTSIEQEFIS
jgi:hypothetical protein